MVLPDLPKHSSVFLQLCKNGMNQSVPLIIKNAVSWNIIKIQDHHFLLIHKNTDGFNLIKISDIIELEIKTDVE